MENDTTIRTDPNRKLSIDGETLVRMAEMLHAGAKLEDLARAFPFYSGNQIADLVEGWEE